MMPFWKYLGTVALVAFIGGAIAYHFDFELGTWGTIIFSVIVCLAVEEIWKARQRDKARRNLNGS